MRKYELLRKDNIEHEGRTLYRIKALRDFVNVKAGDLGGYIQNEDNLSHDGNCWIYENAKVYDRAYVYNNAAVYGNASVYGRARVYNNARVYGYAKIYDSAIVREKAKVNEYAEIYGNAEIYEKAWVFDNVKVYDNAEIYGDAIVHHNATVYGRAKILDRATVGCSATICGKAKVYGIASVHEGTIVGKVSQKYKDIYQEEFIEEDRVVTAILTKDNEILYTIEWLFDYTEEEFIDIIENTDNHLGDAIIREKYRAFIKKATMYFKGAK